MVKLLISTTKYEILRYIWMGSLLLVGITALQASLNTEVHAVLTTQAVIRYSPPDEQACRVEVSTSTSYYPLVDDVDSIKFPGANLDSRAALHTNGKNVFVIGKRTAERAVDGLLYSRALQADTTYYFRVTCNGDVDSGSFHTQSVMLGNTYGESLPVDASRPGEYAWPTLSLNDRTQQIIDPQTGALIRRISLPQDRNITAANQPFQFTRTTGWANPDAALNAQDGNQSATVRGNNQATLLLLPQNDQTYNGYISLFKGSHAANNLFLNWFSVTVRAAISRSECGTAAGDDCKIVTCLTIDGVNCNPGGMSYEQALSPNLASYTFGSLGTAIDLWQAPGQRPLNGAEIAIRQGQVVCDGSTTVSWNSGDYFATFWTHGSTIRINSVSYQVQQLIDPTTLQLTSSCATTRGQPTPYTGMNFGLLLRKKTASADMISVESAQVNYENGVFPFFDYSGEYDLCGTGTVSGPTGNNGYNCSTYQNGSMYWFDSLTGEAHLLALNQGTYGNPQNENCGVFDSSIFDANNPDIWYCGGNYPQRVKYFGNHSEPMNTSRPGHLEEQENLPACNPSNSPTNLPCLTFSGLTNGQTIGSLVAQFDATFDTAAYLYPLLAYVDHGVLVFRFWRSIYGSLGWTVLFDPRATANGEPGNAGCVGGGNPGCVVAAVPSWNRPSARWCGLKSNDPMSIVGWAAIGSYPWSYPSDTTPGVGPYLSTVTGGTALSSALNVAGGLSACGPNSYGVLGAQCTTITVDGEPRDPSPCTASTVACYGEIESGAAGAIGPAQPGDFFAIANTSEIMRLLTKAGNRWTFQRGFNGVVASSVADPQLVTTCNANPAPANFAAGNEWYWNYAADPHGWNQNGTAILDDANGINAHFFIQNGTMVNSYTLDPRCAGQICYQDRVFGSVPQLVNIGATNVQQTNPSFAGFSASAAGNQVQSHPAGPGWSSNGANGSFFLDGRPFNGGPLSGSVASDGASPATRISGQLWKFMASQVPALHRKTLATWATSGYKLLLDVSSPSTGNVLTGLVADSYKYCVANHANECVMGSASGDVYVNAPYVTRPYCHYPSQAGSMPDEFDLCIGDSGMIYNSLIQVDDSVTDLTGTGQRVLTKGLARARLTDTFWHAHAFANGNWAMFKTSWADEVGDMLFSIQIPPPAADSTPRAAMQPLTVHLGEPLTGTVSAYLEFGYGENGAPADLFCTTRKETCATQSLPGLPVDTVNPFLFEQTEAANLIGVPCAIGCSVQVPALPQRIVYLRWVCLDGNGRVIGNSPVLVYNSK